MTHIDEYSTLTERLRAAAEALRDASEMLFPVQRVVGAVRSGREMPYRLEAVIGYDIPAMIDIIDRPECWTSAANDDQLGHTQHGRRFGTCGGW